MVRSWPAIASVDRARSAGPFCGLVIVRERARNAEALARVLAAAPAQL